MLGLDSAGKTSILFTAVWMVLQNMTVHCNHNSTCLAQLLKHSISNPIRWELLREVLINGYSGLFWVHALAVCPGPKTACKHWGAVPEAAIFAFRLLEVVSQGTPFARAREGCGLRDKALLRCVLYTVCPPIDNIPYPTLPYLWSSTHGCGARWDHWVFICCNQEACIKELGTENVHSNRKGRSLLPN